MTGLLEGAYGRAEPVPVPDIPSAAETVCAWLLTAPTAHPLWSQYQLTALRLRDGIPGFDPPARQFDGATHELNVVALNPQHGHQDVGRMYGYCLNGRTPYLWPINIAHQIEGTDDEAARLAELAAAAVVHGWLWPETGDAPDRIRQSWKASLVKTLAHIRGEAHAC